MWRIQARSEVMGRGDTRRSAKMRRLRSQRKKKLRIKRKIAAAKSSKGK
jgi:hypothetical protein